VIVSSSVKDLIQFALDESGNTFSIEDVLAAVESGQFQLWREENSLVVTEILSYPQARVLTFLLAAGDLPTISRMIPVLEHWGSEVEGCRLAATTGRLGWSRSFLTKEQGWKATHVVLTKDI
jgi:hypothetical protein